MENFFRGQEAGQRSQSHKVALEDSKFYQQILRHQIDSLKLEDQLRGRDLQRQHADMMVGQDDASPGASFSSPTSAPSGAPAGGGLAAPASLSDVIGGMARQNFLRSSGASGSDASQGPSTAGQTAVPTSPNSGLAPLTLHSSESIPAGYRAVGPSDISTHYAQPPANFGAADHAGMQRAGHVWLPPITVPELGIEVPGMWFSARAAREEEMRRQLLAEGMKPFKLGAAEDYYVGGRRVASGPGKNVIIPRGGTLANDRSGAVIGRGAPAAPVRGRPGDVFFDPETRQPVGRVPGTSDADQRRQDAEYQREWGRRFREYSNQIAQEQRAHGEQVRAWTVKSRDTAPEEMTEVPTYNPPSFEEWQQTHYADEPIERPTRGGRQGGTWTSMRACARRRRPSASSPPCRPISSMPRHSRSCRRSEASDGA